MNDQEINLDGNEYKIIRATSAFDCGGRCPLRLHVKDNKIIRVEGDDIEEPDQLRACLRCRAYRKHIHHPERLKFPLKRIGNKGEGKFKRISWDEALDEIAEKLKYVKETYGNESILLVGGAGYIGALHDGTFAMMRLLAHFGGYSTRYGNVSSEGCLWACLTQYGSIMVGNSREDLQNAKLIIMWGWDPARMISSTSTMYHLIKAKEKGAKIICIDPRYHDSAVVLADQWIPIYPGTDSAMMISMAYIMIKENLHDEAFLDTYTVGFDKFKNYVLGKEDGIEKTPKWAEKICGVKAFTIEKLAREYATTIPAALMDCEGPARSAIGGQFNRCAMALCAMTGNVGKSGGSAGGGLMGTPVGNMYRSARIPPPGKLTMEIGAKSSSLNLKDRLVKAVHTCKIFDAIMKGKNGGYPFDVKFAWFVNNNFLNQLGNINKSVIALKNLDYMVISELFMTATAKYADIILPVTSTAERNDLTRPWPSGPYYTFTNKAIEPLGECKSDLEIAEELAKKLDLKDFIKYSDDNRILKTLLKLTLDTRKLIRDFKKFKQDGIFRVKLEEPIIAFQEQIENPDEFPFNTPSGKIEIFSQRVANINDPHCPPIPKYIGSWEDRFDPLIKKYPLQLISPHPKARVHSTLYLVEWLKEIDPNRVWINSTDAKSRGISNGDIVHVFNDRGKLMIPAWITERIMPGVVCIFEGAWYDPDEHGIDRNGSVNVLTNDAYSPEGSTALNTCLVNISKV